MTFLCQFRDLMYTKKVVNVNVLPIKSFNLLASE